MRGFDGKGCGKVLWGAVRKGLVKEVAKSVKFCFFFAGGGGMVRFWWGCWLEFVRVCPCSRRCVLEVAWVCRGGRVAVSLRSRGCVLELAGVWCWGSWKYVRVAPKCLGVMP